MISTEPDTNYSNGIDLTIVDVFSSGTVTEIKTEKDNKK
jgi:hypothetical protein